MIDILKTEEGKLVKKSNIDNIQGTWVSLTNPTEKEIEFVSKKYKVEKDFLMSALDDEEMSRLEYDEDNDSTLIIINFPLIIKVDGKNIYETIPLAIIHTEDVVITICLQENLIYDYFKKIKNKTVNTKKKSRFILQIIYRAHSLFITFLRRIDKEGSYIEDEIEKVTKNEAILQLLFLQKSLVYFTTALRSNELVLFKIKRLDFIKLYEDDEELLEDIIIESKQGIDTAKIYSSILQSTMEAISSIINNNMNEVMKSLTVITIALSIPTMVYSWYGMNINLPYMNIEDIYIWITFITLLPLITVIYLVKKPK